VAEDAAVVDLLSGGRLTLAVGQGYAAAEFAGLGVDRRERASRLEEGIAVLRQAWDEPAVHHAGRHWHFNGVPGRPQPGRRLPLLVGAVAERAVERALVLTGILHVAPDADQAWAEAAPGIAYLEGQLGTLREHPALTFPRGDFLVGTPAEVAQRLIALHRDTHFDHFAHWARLPGLSHERTLETLRLVAKEVVPAVREATR
jgi:alkanesulfonate monooxygenase SsuD/methylene tetrahydromethanopterin reductase-like flavin-dependent oxidoreductase (luciferase family)